MLIHKDYLELATLAGMHNLPVQLGTLAPNAGQQLGQVFAQVGVSYRADAGM